MLPLYEKLFQSHTEENPSELLNNKDKKRYQAIVASLLFVSRMTRPDISIQENPLWRSASGPSQNNWKEAIAILRDLWRTRSECIISHKPTNTNLVAYADTLYGGEESRSQSGTLLTLGNQPMGWYSRRQDIVSLSSTEAECMPDCEASKDLLWARQFLKELGIAEKPTLVTDSEGVYNLSKTAKFFRRSCHIDLRYHYLRQEVQKE